MKTKILLVALTSLMLGGSCEQSDPVFNSGYNYGMIELPNGQLVEGQVTFLSHDNKHDTVEVEINGIEYLTHTSKLCLFSQKPDDLASVNE